MAAVVEGEEPMEEADSMLLSQDCFMNQFEDAVLNILGKDA